jgi:pimeloyl-ACP methyl ester carboxylesterase
VVFENSGHLPSMEEPERFMQTVKEWLEQAKG